jgi:hypothetical protein
MVMGPSAVAIPQECQHGQHGHLPEHRGAQQNGIDVKVK